ncbi:MotE family protein [Hyphomonas sp. NPDC076900]|uniref:MotE family protein n=1 Tax=unclassified Hyphomonas TaxID=2630699 RepID=UPI003D08E559
MHNRSNVLLTLGVLFTIGGATRFLPDALAFAEQAPATGANAASAPSVPKAAPAPQPAVASSSNLSQVCFSSESASLLEEDQWLFESEREEIRQQKIELQTWENQLQQQTAELKVLQETLEARWQEMQVSSDKDIDHLARMYSAMKPDQAAQIFNQMDPGFAAGFLRLMASDQAGLILANMESGKAYLVSVKLATMNDDVRNMALAAN